ncbi:MAG TPA: glycosyltransferase [Pyrinomonadaceae bacterium]|jgi:glycosyltransferase involved in cell wall biosynthesis|nr:glycosyltransferase [Pyrinomonadaceae bacterium]
MISVVCVYNDREVLERRLLASLAAQTAPHELIAIDNRASEFESAARALNHGAARARGRWLVFAHQDVALLAPDWLERAELMLERSRASGWFGVAGYTEGGRHVGILLDRAAVWGAPFDLPVEVQTLDECVLMHGRDEGTKLYFDEGLKGWHAYGVDACCAAIRSGGHNYVVPLPVWHDSKAINVHGLEEAHAYVWRKHGADLKRIHTMSGILPDYYGWQGSRWKSLPARVRRRLSSAGYRLAGHRDAFRQGFLETLEALTRGEETVEYLHARAGFERIEAAAMLPHSERRRRVIHRFLGWGLKDLESDCVVVATDLSESLDAGLEDLRALRGRVRRLLLCIEIDGAPSLVWKELQRHASATALTLHYDKTPTAILEMSNW